jgi:hypothetical protein
MGRCAFDLCGNIRFILYFHYICEMKKSRPWWAALLFSLPVTCLNLA